MDTTTRHPVGTGSWSAQLGSDQGLLLSTPARLLTVAAQGPLDGCGRLLHEDDPAAQLALTLANIAAVLEAAGMGWADVVQLHVYTTDLPSLLEVYDTLVEHLGDAGSARPPRSSRSRGCSWPG